MAGRTLHIARLLPNLITLMALCAGLSSVRYALAERWEVAAALLVLAGLLDAMDGRVARYLNATSALGEQLDSLADVINFGVCPALVLFLWALEPSLTAGWRGLGWAAALFYVMCCALRLARFNVGLQAADNAPWRARFFVGVPAPAGALLALTPLMLSFVTEAQWLRAPALVLPTLVLTGALMASRVPTFSFKRVGVPRRYVLPAMLALAALVVLLIVAPWWMLGLGMLVYLALIPLSVRSYLRLKQAGA